MKLYNTTIYRVSIQFAVSFAVLSVITLLSVYYSTFSEIEEQVERELLHEVKDLERYFKKGDFNFALNLLKLRDHYGRHLNHYYTLTKNGEVIAGSNLLIINNAKLDYEKYGVAFFNMAEVVNDEDHPLIIKFAVQHMPDNVDIIVGQAQSSLTELREHTLMALGYAVAFTMIIALFIGTYMSRSVLLRINRVDSGMDGVIESDFTKLLAVPEKEDEFQALTLKLNTMLSRIEKLISGMRQVSDNIAHDLRSPLTRMRSRVEVTLLQDRDSDEYRNVMQKVIDDCDDLLRTFNALLAITQAESGVFRDSFEQLDLSSLADELADLYQAVIEDAGLRFVWHKPEKICVRGSRHSLSQAINNLLENAIKYTPKGGCIELQVVQENKRPVLIVRDDGPGIPEKEREKVLERFYRLDEARSQSGNGLGLSLVNAVVKLHGAELTLSDNNPGLKVEITFPENNKQ